MKMSDVKKIAREAFVAGNEEVQSARAAKLTLDPNSGYMRALHASFESWWKQHGPKLRKCDACGGMIEPDDYVDYYGMAHHKACASLREAQS
jgi:hypothetical protein